MSSAHAKQPVPLARDGVSLSRIGLGTVKLGRTAGLKYPEPFELPTDEEVSDLFDAARDLGVTLVDTAPAYGSAEERVGKAIASDRDRWLLVTKVGESFADGASSFDFSPEGVIASVERSLRRLGTTYLDGVLVHSDGVAELELERLGTLDALETCRSRGLVRCIGVSPKTPEGASLACALGDVLMVTRNTDDHASADAIKEAAKLGVSVLVKKALRSGHVRGDDDVRAAIRFALSPRGVGSLVIGTKSPRNLEVAVRASQGVESGPESAE